MAISPIRMVEGLQVANAATAYYTTPANSTVVLKKLTLTNTTATAVAVTIYLVNSGGTADAAHTVTYQKVIPPNNVAGGVIEVYEAENHVLLAGDTLQAKADTAAAVTLIASGQLFQ